ncbi:zinc ribbon domain-containing protein [Cuspidothrix issatschenkoi]|uniref:zinc ribbon domain-containing protein n=1 Tax=Cuspidothrix issatschenkoi TaxID=230752 RepID=UPI0039688D23
MSVLYQEVDRFFPSSKTCHVCLNQVGSLPLDIRFWTCEKCQTKHDRDINAAINLTRRGTTNTLAAPCTERSRSISTSF